MYFLSIFSKKVSAIRTRFVQFADITWIFVLFRPQFAQGQCLRKFKVPACSGKHLYTLSLLTHHPKRRSLQLRYLLPPIQAFRVLLARRPLVGVAPIQHLLSQPGPRASSPDPLRRTLRDAFLRSPRAECPRALQPRAGSALGQSGCSLAHPLRAAHSVAQEAHPVTSRRDPSWFTLALS